MRPIFRLQHRTHDLRSRAWGVFTNLISKSPKRHISNLLVLDEWVTTFRDTRHVLGVYITVISKRSILQNGNPVPKSIGVSGSPFMLLQSRNVAYYKTEIPYLNWQFIATWRTKKPVCSSFYEMRGCCRLMPGWINASAFHTPFVPPARLKHESRLCWFSYRLDATAK